jgi:hypothetical protein
MAEIDDNELQTLRNAARFIAEMEKKPEGRKTIQKFAKEMNPSIRTEEDVANEYAAPIKSELEELKAWKKELTGNIDQYNEEQKWNDVKGQYGYTEDGLKSLKEFAAKNEIKNPKHAAAVWEKENPPAPATPSFLGSVFTHSEMTGEGKKEELDRINKHPSKYEDEQVMKFYSEKRANG